MKPIDTSIEFIDNVGKVIKKIETKEVDKTQKQNDIGEELSNVVNYLYDMAKEENIKTKPLWLDKIPDTIYVEELKKKYNYQIKKNDITKLIYVCWYLDCTYCNCYRRCSLDSRFI